jgi:DnaJ-class molecular chaperone
MDYYAILNVNRDASFQDIAIAFRKLALTYHPSKNIQNKAATNFKFCQICEAFEVLSTCKESFFLYVLEELRDFYDRYGEQVLKNGIPGKTIPLSHFSSR